MKRFEHVYNMLMGYMIEQDPTIANEFEGGDCEALYGLAYDARVRLSQILDGNSEGENEDVMEIVNAYEKMQKILCEKCYHYGYFDAKKD